MGVGVGGVGWRAVIGGGVWWGCWRLAYASRAFLALAIRISNLEVGFALAFRVVSKAYSGGVSKFKYSANNSENVSS
jgi:hypothetical protein